MKENRFSMAPKVVNSLKSNLPGQSNIKTTEAKSRKSLHPNNIVGPRLTMANVNKLSESRFIKDVNVIDESINKIMDFLIKESYDKPASKNNLTSPNTKDFMNLFNFVAKKFRPDFNFQITKVDEEIIPILINEYKYPGVLSKNYFSSVGAPNTWPYLLAIITWMVDSIEALNFELNHDIQELISIEESKNRSINDLSNEVGMVNLQLNIFDKNFKEYLMEAFKQSHLLKGDNLNLTEIINNKTEEQKACINSMIEKSNQLTIQIEKLLEELERNNPPQSEVNLKLDASTQEVNNYRCIFNSNDKKINELVTCLNNKNKSYENKKEKNQTLNTQLEEIEIIIKHQKVSFEEFEKIKQNIVNADKQLNFLNSKKKEISDSILHLNNSIEDTSQLLTEKIKNTLLICEKLQLSKETHFEELIKELTQKKRLTESDLNEFINLNANIVNTYVQNLNSINVQVKETEEKLIHLKSDNRKLEDYINENNELLNQKRNEYNTINVNMNCEKDKSVSLLQNKGEDIKRSNENILKLTNILSEKEKVLYDLKKEEENLRQKYLEDEQATEIFMKSLDKVYIDEFNEVEKTKNDNIRELRKANSRINKVFEEVKKDNLN
jgi:SMC interacting uncharacterized protein involved in chromosome segregation